MLDPTNPGSLGYPIKPLLQAALSHYNPVTDQWALRYRGFIEEMDYAFDPSQKVNRLTISLIDMFEIVSAIEMLPGYFGDTPPAGAEGQVFFEDTAFTPADVDLGESGMKLRIEQVLGNCGIPDDFFVCFSGNVNVHETTYSSGESAMTAIYEAADAEFPGVSNVYCDRRGRLCVHGRFAKFDPEGTAATTTPEVWDFHSWKVGDGAAVALLPDDRAQVRALAFNRGLSKIINRSIATPIGIADADVNGQIVENTPSVGQYGIRSWSAQNLITKNGLASGPTAISDLAETKNFAHYYTRNYHTPENRILGLVLRTMHPDRIGAAANWHMLSLADIADRIEVKVASPGGGGFDDSAFFVEGIHEEVKPLTPQYDDITMTFDLSPFEYFADNPWSD